MADARVDLLIDPASAAYRDQARYAQAFGGDPLVVLVQPQPGQNLLTPEHLVGLAALEGGLAAAPGVKRVYGPGTLVNTLATEVTRRALELCGAEGKAAEDRARAAAQAAGRPPSDVNAAGQAAFDAAVRACAQRLAQQYPTLGVPALNNPAFYQEVLLEPGGKQVRPFWAWALPDLGHALVTVRLDPNASLAQVGEVLRRLDAAFHEPCSTTVRPGQCLSANLGGLDYHVSGIPALTAALAQVVQNQLLLLLPLTLVAMLLVTLVVIRVSLRLLAIPLAVLAAVWTAGAAGWLGLPLTPATLAVLPVVLGLATDYALQAANRLAVERGQPAERVARMAAAVLPATGLAALATSAGVLAFAFSPVPLVRQFAVFMALGVVCAYAVSVVVGLPLYALALDPRLRSALPRVRLAGAAGSTAVAPSWMLLARIGRAPLLVVAPLAVAGLLGWLLLPSLRVETDPSRLLPAGSPALEEANAVRQAVGMVGEVDLVLAGGDTSSPEAVAWLDQATAQAARDSGGDLRELSSLPAFLAGFNGGKLPDAKTTDLILQRIPPYFTQAVITRDHTLARSIFGLSRLGSVEDDQQLVRRLNALPPAPTGYRAYPAGLTVVAAGALDQLLRDQPRLNLLALALVLGVLAAAYLLWQRTLLPAVLAVLPSAAAAGWATGLLYLLGGRLSPITVLLAGVVVAFATEFSVLWLARFQEARRFGLDPDLAADQASRRIGPAVVASALALVMGFLVLGLSSVPTVREFGLWSGADLALATTAVLVLLPPLARALLRGRPVAARVPRAALEERPAIGT